MSLCKIDFFRTYWRYTVGQFESKKLHWEFFFYNFWWFFKWECAPIKRLIRLSNADTVVLGFHGTKNQCAFYLLWKSKMMTVNDIFSKRNRLTISNCRKSLLILGSLSTRIRTASKLGEMKPKLSTSSEVSGLLSVG